MGVRSRLGGIASKVKRGANGASSTAGPSSSTAMTSSSTAVSSSTAEAPKSFAKTIMSSVSKVVEELNPFHEKEWTCQCGHKFMSPDEWVPSEPVYCEAPRCPNPRFYLDGPGRALLESNKPINLSDGSDPAAKKLNK